MTARIPAAVKVTRAAAVAENESLIEAVPSVVTTHGRPETANASRTPASPIARHAMEHAPPAMANGSHGQRMGNGSLMAPAPIALHRVTVHVRLAMAHVRLVMVSVRLVMVSGSRGLRMARALPVMASESRGARTGPGLTGLRAMESASRG